MTAPTSTPTPTPQQRLLIIEPDDRVRERLEAAFTLDGNDAIGVDHVGGGRSCLETEPWDLILLSDESAGGDAYKLLREIRTGAFHSTQNPATTLPVVIVTKYGGEEHRIRAFELGCDDYVTKPFSFGELRGRVAAVLRRTDAPHA